MAFPFRFYGRDARDWAEGGNLGHPFDVLFSRAPTDSERERLGTLWDEATATGILDPGRWSWAGRFAEFMVGERWPSRGGHIGAVADFLKQAHGVVPIVDVTYHLARESDGPWDRWSLSQGAPGPGPEMPSHALVAAFRRPVDASLPKPASDPVFDSAVARSSSARAARRVADAITLTPGAGKVGLTRVERALEAPKHSSPFRAPVPEFVEVTDSYGKHFLPADGDHPLLNPGRPLALSVKGQDGYGGVAWMEEGERHEARIPGGYLGGISLSPDGNEILLRQSALAWHVDLRTGTQRSIYRKEMADGYDLRATAFVDDGRWAVLSSKQLQILQPGEVPKVVATVPIADAMGMTAARSGQVLVVSQAKKVTVVAVVGEKVKKVGTFVAPLGFGFETEGSIYLRHADAFYELTHVDAALEALAPRKPKKTKAVKAGLKLSDAPVDFAPSREEPELGKRFGNARVTVGPSGRTAAVPLVEHAGLTVGSGLRYLDDAGQVRDVSTEVEKVGAGKAVLSVSISPSGRRIAVAVDAAAWQTDEVVEVDAASGAVSKVAQVAYLSEGKAVGVHLVGDDDLLLLTEKVLRRLRRGTDGWREEASLKVGQARLMEPREVSGTLIVPVLCDSPAPLLIVSGKDGLKKLGEIKGSIRTLDWRGDELLAWETQGRWWRVEGL